MLKLVYWFGIPNSNPQMLKSVDFWCKLSSVFLVAEPKEQCFELFKTQNSQKFPGFCPWTPLGRAYSSAPDSPAAQLFFSSLHMSKNRHPQKIAGYSIVLVCQLVVVVCPFVSLLIVLIVLSVGLFITDSYNDNTMIILTNIIQKCRVSSCSNNLKYLGTLCIYMM